MKLCLLNKSSIKNYNVKKNLIGIVELKGKHVRLEDIEDPKLARVLHERRSREFRFRFKKGPSGHIDKYNDNYKERHKESYQDEVHRNTSEESSRHSEEEHEYSDINHY